MARKKIQVVEPATEPVVVAQDAAAPTVVTVRVRPGSRLSTIQAAGMAWGREPQAVAADAPYLAELRRCPYLEVLE